MKKIILLEAFSAIFSVNLFGQIHSSLTGGYWNDPGTWVGDVIPGSGNDVIIEGPVILASASGYTILTEHCHNLTITAAGSLKNGDYGGGSAAYTFVVYGNVVNKGFLGQMYDDGIYIKVNGNIVNEGVCNAWRNYFLFYSNTDIFSLTLTNTGTSDIQVNSSDISGLGAAAFSMLSGGGMQTVSPDLSYGATIQFSPADADATALLTLDCDQVGSLNSIELDRFNYESVFTGVGSPVQVPGGIILNQNYPNPVSVNTTITWQLHRKSHIVFKVYDFSGCEVETLVDCEQAKGEYQVTFNASGLPAGVYFYQLQAN